MQSRYLGSDVLSQRQLQAQEDASQANTLAVGRIAKATDQTVQGLVQNQQQIGQMQVAYATAQAQAANNGALSGFSKAVGEVGDAYMRYTNNERQQKKLEFEQAKELRAEQARLDKQQREELGKQEYVGALQTLGTVAQKYVQNDWNEGTLNYKNEASKALAAYKNLQPEQLATLVDRINTTAANRDDEVRKSREAEIEKQQNLIASSEKSKLGIAFAPDIARLKNLPPTEQALPYLQNIDERLDNYLKLNNGLSFNQKMEAVNDVTQQVLTAYGSKAEGFSQWRSSMEARAKWAVGSQKAYLQFQQDGDLSKYKDSLLQLKIETGKDYREYIVAPGESEKSTLEIANTVEGLQKLSDIKKERTGTQFEFGDENVRTLTAAFIVNPNVQINLENNPILSKNPGVKAALANAKAIREARQDLATLGVDNAKVNKELADYDLSNINNFSSVTRSIINANRSGGSQPTQEQQYFANVLQKANEATGGAIGEAVSIIQNAGSRALTPQEIAQIQQTLKDSEAGIRQAQQATKAEYAAKVNQFNTKHEALLKQFGGRIPTDSELAEIYKTGFPKFQESYQRLQQDLEQSGASVVPAYGQQSNFNQAGQGLGAAVSPDGKVRIAPRTTVHVQTYTPDGGSPFITPVAAGTVANHSFNKGNGGGGYLAGRSGRQHAGVDFPLAEGQKAVSVVSGRVVRVGTASGYGNYIDIMGDNGFVYRYAHSRSFVKEGERVQAGQPVASPNHSGTNVGGAHLHYEVRNGASYKPDGDWGTTNTVDPIAHLRSLTPLAGSITNAPQLAGQSVGGVSRQLPWAKTTAPALFTPGGGALQANLFQQIGRPTRNANQVFTAQRPLTKGIIPAYTGGKRPINAPNESYGYAWIAQRPDFARKLSQVATALGVPASWIADIMRQETGENFALARAYHENGRGENPNRNYGLFGFGNDSGVPNYDRLTEVQQLDAYYRYLTENGWHKHYQRTGGNVSIGQLWAMTKMGTKWRNDILNGRDPATMVDKTGYSQLQQFQMLGKWAGRQYDFGTGTQGARSQRNRAVGKRASSVVDQALAANNSPDVLYRTTTV